MFDVPILRLLFSTADFVLMTLSQQCARSRANTALLLSQNNELTKKTLPFALRSSNCCKAALQSHELAPLRPQLSFRWPRFAANVIQKRGVGHTRTVHCIPLSAAAW